ncbi:MAG: hypothetical protein ACOYBQ_09855 [Fluviibacter sp.]
MQAFSTPILLLTFNRPELVRAQITRLRKIQPSKLFVSSDGPRVFKPGEVALVESCREEIANGVDWPCEVFTKYESENLGCGLGVSSAISWFFDQVEEGIIMEDDCQLSNSFFPYCQKLLEIYRNDDEVAGISADFRMLRCERPFNEYGFIRFAQIWGWASWRRVWQHYDFTMSDWDGDISKVSGLAGLGENSARYWQKNFDKMKQGEIDTWDFQLAYLVLNRGWKFIHPMCNLVTNIGYGAAATHTRSKNDVSANLPAYDVAFPLKENRQYTDYDEYLRESSFVDRSIAEKVFRRCKAFFNRLL